MARKIDENFYHYLITQEGLAGRTAMVVASRKEGEAYNRYLKYLEENLSPPTDQDADKNTKYWASLKGAPRIDSPIFHPTEKPYLHYWIEHYEQIYGTINTATYHSLYKNYMRDQAQKMINLTNQKFNTNININDKKTYKNTKDLLSTFFKNPDSIIDNIFTEGQKPDNVFTSGRVIPGINRSYASLSGRENVANINAIAGDYVNSINYIVTDLKNILNKIELFLQKYTSSALVQEIKDIILQPQNGRNTFGKTSNDDIRDYAYQEIRKSTGMTNRLIALPSYDKNKINEDLQDACSSYIQISAAVEALNEMINSGVSGTAYKGKKYDKKDFKSNSQLVVDIVGAVGGLFNGFGGFLQELAVQTGFYNSDHVMYEHLKFADARTTGKATSTVYPSVKWDERLVTPINWNQVSQSKNDITIEIKKINNVGDFTVVGDFGISVKTTGFNKNQKTGMISYGNNTVALHSPLSLGSLIDKAIAQNPQDYEENKILNLGASHAYYPEKAESYSQGWRTMVRSIIAMNFCDYIFGKDFFGDNAYFLSVNGVIRPVYEIISHLVDHETHLHITESGASKNMIELKHTPQDGEESPELGKERSKRVVEEIRKLKVGINLSASLLNSLFKHK